METVSPHEFLTADVALVWFNASVDLHMANKMMLHFKFLTTNTTAVRSKTKMHAHMAIPLTLVSEVFATLTGVKFVNNSGEARVRGIFIDRCPRFTIGAVTGQSIHLHFSCH